MLVKCISNKGNSFPPILKKSLSDSLNYNDFTFTLTPGNIYTVYGMTIRVGYVWYYVCEDGYNDYPIWRPALLFELVNHELSKYWIFNYESYEDNFLAIWAFPEWAKNHYEYYDRLTDWKEKESKIFQRYKLLMDLEFPNPSIALTAAVLDDTWLLCPTCIDAWKSQSDNGMVICPLCKQMMHNPRYGS